MKRTPLFCPNSLTEFVQSCTFNSCFCPFGLETSDRTSDRSKPATVNARDRAGEERNFSLFISCLAI